VQKTGENQSQFIRAGYLEEGSSEWGVEGENQQGMERSGRREVPLSDV
jgi:hypothetical protein